MEIGVVGKPNVGKSTFFKAVTLAEVEIANFPFTTIKANVGMGYVKTPCPCREFNVTCNPNNSFCKNGYRFTPVKLIDVAGLVPGAHEGKGLGNQFLDELRQADALIHVLDISGRTNERGEVTENYDPERDVKFLEDEINLWFEEIINRNLDKIKSKIKYESKDFVRELGMQLSGLGIKEFHVEEALKITGFKGRIELSQDELRIFAKTLREISKPIVLAANKIDVGGENYERLKKKFELIPCCAEAELALRQAERKGIVEYTPGESSFLIKEKLEEKQRIALEFIKQKILERYGSTGIQQVLNKVVFEVLGYIIVYPVENEHKLTDSKGRVLPDSYLVPSGTTALELAYKIHTQIGEGFIGAIDCRTQKKVGKEYVLKHGDVIKILSRA